MALFENKLERSINFNEEPRIVADACQAIITSIGLNIKEFSRRTGIISVQTPTFGFNGDKFLTLTISKIESGTNVHVSVSAQQGLFSGRGAHKLMTEFFSKLAQHPLLKGKSTARQ